MLQNGLTWRNSISRSDEYFLGSLPWLNQPVDRQIGKFTERLCSKEA
jgi:hypothetical protein